MENTLENKAKFFALYYGQEALKASSVQGVHKVGKSFMGKIYRDQYLELKPLSSISDEDAIELVRIRFSIDKGDLKDVTDIKVVVSNHPNRQNAVSIEAILKHKKWNDHVERIFIGEDSRTPYQIVDFLRSRGYALPWMGLSLDKLIEYGWIKLKEVKP